MSSLVFLLQALTGASAASSHRGFCCHPEPPLRPAPRPAGERLTSQSLSLLQGNGCTALGQRSCAGASRGGCISEPSGPWISSSSMSSIIALDLVIFDVFDHCKLSGIGAFSMLLASYPSLSRALRISVGKNLQTQTLLAPSWYWVSLR
jgi:hypothetical protein